MGLNKERVTRVTLDLNSERCAVFPVVKEAGLGKGLQDVSVMRGDAMCGITRKAWKPRDNPEGLELIHPGEEAQLFSVGHALS